MEQVEGKLEVFSAILLQQYIRLQTAAAYYRAQKNMVAAKFKLSADVYAKMCAEPLQTSLLGLQLVYDENAQILTVTPDEEFLQEFENNIMRDVALQYADTYNERYAAFISFAGIV